MLIIRQSIFFRGLLCYMSRSNYVGLQLMYRQYRQTFHYGEYFKHVSTKIEAFHNKNISMSQQKYKHFTTKIVEFSDANRL